METASFQSIHLSLRFWNLSPPSLSPSSTNATHFLQGYHWGFAVTPTSLYWYYQDEVICTIPVTCVEGKWYDFSLHVTAPSSVTIQWKEHACSDCKSGTGNQWMDQIKIKQSLTSAFIKLGNTGVFMDVHMMDITTKNASTISILFP